MDELRYEQMSNLQKMLVRARFLDAGENDGYFYLIGEDKAPIRRNRKRQLHITIRPARVPPATPKDAEDLLEVLRDLLADVARLQEQVDRLEIAVDRIEDAVN